MGPSVVAAIASLIVPLRSVAQDERVGGTAEIAASLLQGNTDQRTMFTKGELSLADSTLQGRVMLSFGYADATRDSLPREVTKRTWLSSLSLDYRPSAMFSPFVFATYEASYEKRVRDRVGAGVGGKVVLVRSEGSEASVSLAVLAERLRPTQESPDPTIVSTARWSGRARFRHRVDDRLRFSHTTFFQPEFTELQSYTVNSTSEVSYALRSETSLTVSYLVLYDSSARARGARSNNDGQLLVGLKTGF
jgi:hypothetical protein